MPIAVISSENTFKIPQNGCLRQSACHLWHGHNRYTGVYYFILYYIIIFFLKPFTDFDTFEWCIITVGRVFSLQFYVISCRLTANSVLHYINTTIFVGKGRCCMTFCRKIMIVSSQKLPMLSGYYLLSMLTTKA